MIIKKLPTTSVALSVLLILAGSVVGTEPNTGQESGRHNVISFATGPDGSIYSEIGKMISRLGGDFDQDIRSVITNGSWQNLHMLDSQTITFALTQQDALVEYLRLQPESKIEIIKPIFEEYLHILVRSRFNIPGASQLRNLRIFPGLSRSGTAFTTQNLFNTLGISSGQYTFIEIDSLNKVEALFREDELDVATYVDGLGTKSVAELMNSGVAHLFSLDHEARKLITIGRSIDRRSGIYIRSIPAGLYNNQPFDINAISVPVLLITISTTDSTLTNKIVAAIDDATSVLDTSSCQGLFSGFEATQSLDNFPIYENGAYMPSSEGKVSIANMIMAAAFVLWLIMSFRFRVRLFRFFRFHPVRGLALAAVVLSFTCAYGAYLAEHDINANFGSFSESVYSVAIYISSGMEDRVPVTGLGRLFCLAALFMGPLMIALMTGLFASSFIIHFMEAGMPKQLSDHFVIANWNSRALSVIEHLRSPILDHSVIAVISDDPGVDFKELSRQFLKQRSKGFEDVYFCPGDPGTKLSLLNANVQKSDAIIVLGDDRERSSDEKTIRTVFVLKEIGEEYEVELDVVVELRNVANVKVITEMRRTFPGTLDYVASGTLRTMLLAQCALNKGLSDVYRQLLTPTKDTCELYTVEIPDSAVGSSFRAYRIACAKVTSKEGVIPMGIGRRCNGRTKFEINPLPLLANKTDNPFHTLQKGDMLLVIAYDPPKTGDLPDTT